MDVKEGKQRDKEGGTSSEEFQNKLCVWFEEKGVLAELRTHLRHQMIETLKTSQLGRQMSSEKKKNVNISPKHQAINLLIAEYLLHQGYQYSMSVFSSEVGTLYSLPDYTLQDQQGGIRFQGRDMWDILESLGLPAECGEAQCVAAAYNDSSNKIPRRDCLLVCLLRMLPPVLRSKHLKGLEEENLQCKVKKNLLDASMKVENGKYMEERKTYKDEEAQCNRGEAQEHDLEIVIRQIHENMQQAFDYEIEIVKEEERQRCTSIIQEKERTLREQMEEERKKVKKIESRMRESVLKEMEDERNRMREEYRMKEIQLERETAREMELERYKILSEYREMIQSKKASAEAVSMTDKQHSYLSVTLDKLQEQSNNMKLKEELLDKRLKEVEENFNTNDQISHRSKQQVDIITQSNMQLQEERQSIKKLKCDLESLIKQMEDERNNKTIITNKTETVCKDIQTEKVITCRDTQTENAPFDNNAQEYSSVKSNHKDIISPTPLDFVLKTLQKENSHLKSLTTQQNTKIEELMLKQLNMSMEVSEARVQVQELSKQLKDLLKSSTAPAASNRRQLLREMLSGKYTTKSKKNGRPLGYNIRNRCKKTLSESSSEETHISLGKKRSSRRGSKHSNNISHTEGDDREDDSPTDEVLKDAKRRLRMLELETEAVDRSYQEFKLRQEVEKKGADKRGQERRCSAPTRFHHNNITDYQSYKTNFNKPEVDASVSCHYVTPKYNMFRRVHETTMNIDNNVLHKYISANKIKHHEPSVNTKRNNVLTTNHLLNSSSNVSPANKFAGTTAFLLKRIENCTSGIRRYNMEKRNNIGSHLTVDDWKSKITIRNENNLNKNVMNYKSDDYSQYIGKSSQQYKIKPLIHWRNIQNVQKIAEDNKIPDCVIQSEANLCGNKTSTQQNKDVNEGETEKRENGDLTSQLEVLNLVEESIVTDLSKKVVDDFLNHSESQHDSALVIDDEEMIVERILDRENIPQEKVPTTVTPNIGSKPDSSVLKNANFTGSYASVLREQIESVILNQLPQPTLITDENIDTEQIICVEGQSHLLHTANEDGIHEVENKNADVNLCGAIEKMTVSDMDEINGVTESKDNNELTVTEGGYESIEPIETREVDEIREITITKEVDINEVTAVESDVSAQESNKMIAAKDDKIMNVIQTKEVQIAQDDIRKINDISFNELLIESNLQKVHTKSDPLDGTEKKYEDTVSSSLLGITHSPSDKDETPLPSSVEVLSENSSISVPRAEDDEDESFWK